MLKKRLITAALVMSAAIIGFQQNAFGFAGKARANFTVRIENVSSPEGLETVDGKKYPFALSPGLYVITKRKMDFFKSGNKASAGLEAQAEDGNPDVLAKALLTKIGSVRMGVFNTPSGMNMPAPILPGGFYEFSFTATEGMKLNFIAMFGQSNDLFYAPGSAIDLFENGKPLTGDISNLLTLWDAGTEVNQAPGVGDQQAPRQSGPNTGTAEMGRVGVVKDGFTYPATTDVLKVTITAS